MIEVYVDVAAASVEAGGTEAGNQLAADPQAVRALRYLADAGIRGTPPTGSVRRCDAVARDLQAAAMEILAAVAMPAGTEDRVTP